MVQLAPGQPIRLLLRRPPFANGRARREPLACLAAALGRSAGGSVAALNSFMGSTLEPVQSWLREDQPRVFQPVGRLSETGEGRGLNSASLIKNRGAQITLGQICCFCRRRRPSSMLQLNLPAAKLSQPSRARESANSRDQTLPLDPIVLPRSPFEGPQLASLVGQPKRLIGRLAGPHCGVSFCHLWSASGNAARKRHSSLLPLGAAQTLNWLVQIALTCQTAANLPLRAPLAPRADGSKLCH